MSARACIGIIKLVEKELKCDACRAFYLFFATSCNKFNNTGA